MRAAAIDCRLAILHELVANFAGDAFAEAEAPANFLQLLFFVGVDHAVFQGGAELGRHFFAGAAQAVGHAAGQNTGR